MSINNSALKPTREDTIASLVVFIIAVPLSLGIALASGAPPAAGLIAAVVGGIVAGALAGAPLGVTGPAAGLTALVFQMVQQYGIEALAVITILCGAFQLAFAALRTGKAFALIPKPVLEGTLSAIGLVIVLGQLHVLMGQPIPKAPVLSLVGLPSSVMSVFGSNGYLVAPVLICGVVALATQLAWPKIAGRLSWIPGALPAVIAATLLSLAWQMPRVEIAPLLPAVAEGFNKIASMWWLSGLAQYLLPAFGLAVVASAESLLTARAVDTLVQKRPGFTPANLNRELFAQGTANLVSGMVGGLPMTAVMVRSAANVNAGGQTRWSTMLHGAWIAVFVGLLPFVLSSIPLTALAAVLIITGVRLVNARHFLETLRHHRMEGASWLLTTSAIFATDLLKGLIIGLVAHICMVMVVRTVAAQPRGQHEASKSSH